ncbi:MAG TPA: ABC transporter permease, partial [Gemmatimonadaceae bacterium]|nr:ABC transporter permease [Gemmatimonadaceae bacterium]
LDDARALPAFQEIAAYAPGALNLGLGDAPARIGVGVVTPNLFPMLGVSPVLGRHFTAAEGKPGAPEVALISHAIWRRHYAGSAEVLERDVVLNGKPYRIAGVMPPRLAFPSEAEVWIPLHLPYGWNDFEPFRSWMPSTVVARLASDATLDQARTQVHTVVRRFERENGPPTPEAAALVRPLRERLVGTRRAALLVLMGATGLVLLIACANVTNLLVSRSTTRRAEMALRSALGASRGRIFRQLLIESVLLALAGAALGVVLAAVALGALGSLMPAQLAGLASAQLDLRVLAFSLALAIATGITFGVWPALGATRTGAAEVMKGGGGGAATAREGTRLRRLFVVTEVALALVLAVGAGLMLRTMQVILSQDPGVRPQGVATLELSLNRATYTTAEQRLAFFERVLERLERIGGVETAAIVNELPLRGVPTISITVHAEGTPLSDDPRDNVFAQMLHVTPHYFRTMGIPLLRGRAPLPRADTLAAGEMVISRSLADLLFPGQDPLGRRVTLPRMPSRVVVGVAGNILAISIGDTARRPQMYWPLGESPPVNAAVVARGSGRADVLAARLEQTVTALDPLQAVHNVRTMEEVMSRAITTRRVNAILITTFSAVALLLAAVGIYGVIAYTVARRTREIGIRIALGARGFDVVRMIMREGMALAVAGILVGVAGAWALRRVIESLLYEVHPGDPVAFVVAQLVMLTIAFVATLLPARRAALVNPVEAIRADA